MFVARYDFLRDCETILTTRTNTENHPGRVFRPPKSLNVLLKVSDHIHKARTVGKYVTYCEDISSLQVP
jgi:hypothetical protein